PTAINASPTRRRRSRPKPRRRVRRAIPPSSRAAAAAASLSRDGNSASDGAQSWRGLFGRRRCRRRRLSLRGTLLVFQLLARFIGAGLQLFLQFALLLLEHLWIGRRAVIGLGEIGQRQYQADRLPRGNDRLNDEHLALLQLADHLGIGFVVGHAAVGETDH